MIPRHEQQLRSFEFLPNLCLLPSAPFTDFQPHSIVRLRPATPPLQQQLPEIRPGYLVNPKCLNGRRRRRRLACLASGLLGFDFTSSWFSIIGSDLQQTLPPNSNELGSNGVEIMASQHRKSNLAPMSFASSSNAKDIFGIH